MQKFRTLNADEIECRVKKITEKGAIILLYKTARTDMDLLDEIIGAENWESDYKEIKNNLYAGIGIKIDDKWIWKWDCGIESRGDDDGNQKKGEASDAFKRAGFKWGIGRELYTSPFIFFPAKDMTIKDGKTFDTFSVKSIKYDDKRRIISLSIVNNKTHKTWLIGNDTSAPPKSGIPETEDDPDNESEPFKVCCVVCGAELTPSVHDYSVKHYKKPLCMTCQKKVKK